MDFTNTVSGEVQSQVDVCHEKLTNLRYGRFRRLFQLSIVRFGEREVERLQVVVGDIGRVGAGLLGRGELLQRLLHVRETLGELAGLIDSL